MVQILKFNLKRKRVVQPVELHADIYGKSVTYHGVVEGFSGGSGSAFSAIPAQNATGNWIKVVQRLPIRISLNEEELKTHPLKSWSFNEYLKLILVLKTKVRV